MPKRHSSSPRRASARLREKNMKLIQEINTIIEPRTSMETALILPVNDALPPKKIITKYCPVDLAIKENPLLVHVIFLNIMSMLPVNSLKKCRLVSKTWNQTSLKTIAKRNHSVTITSAVDAYIFRTVMADSSDKNGLSAAYEYFTNFCVKNAFSRGIFIILISYGQYIKKLHLEGPHPNSSGVGAINVSNIHILINTISNLEELTLMNSILVPPRALHNNPDLKLGLLKRLTSLKSISITLDTVRNGVMEDHLPIFMDAYRKLFAAAPNLQTAVIDTTWNFWTGIYLKSVIQLLSNTKTLRHLTIRKYIRQRDFAALCKSEFRLETLRIGELMDMSVPSFLNLLDTQAFFLKTLYVNFSTVGEVMFNFPHLPYLKHLTIQSPPASRHRFSKKVELPDKIHQLLPSLKKLEIIDLHPETMTEVFLKFAFVEDLSVSTHFQRETVDVNAVLSGLPSPIWIHKVLLDSELAGEESEESLNNFLRIVHLAAFPNLLNFRKLRRLQLASGFNSGYIRDCLADLVLRYLPRLELLEIKDAVFSEAAINELMLRHNVVRLEPPPFTTAPVAEA